MSESKQPNTPATCAELAAICEAHGKDIGILVLIGPSPTSKTGRDLQLVTFGREAEHKAESHYLKEDIKDALYDGDAPDAREVHESFILDAAKNKQHKDELLAVAEQLLWDFPDLPEITGGQSTTQAEKLIRAARAAIASAKGA